MSPDKPPVEGSFDGSTVLGQPQARVRLAEATFNRLRFASTTTDSGLFVFGAPWFRGWRVEIDGKPGRLQRVEAVYPAVELPPGDHDVEFRFESPASIAGMVGLLGGIAGLAIYALWSVFPRRRALMGLTVVIPVAAAGGLWYRSLYWGPSAETHYVWESVSAKPASCEFAGANCRDTTGR
jgi:hypothetical protein